MDKSYIVNYGDSDTYRVASWEVAKSIAEKMSDELKKKYAESYNGALLTVDLRQVDARDAAQYPELTEANYKGVLEGLDREMRVRGAVRELYNNAPYADA